MTPIVPTLKRGPGRPSNSELLARFANSHKPSGAPPLLPELVPKPASAPAAGRKRGRGRSRRGAGGSRTPASARPPKERPSRLSVASGPGRGAGRGRGRGRKRRGRSKARGSDDEEEDDEDIDDLLDSKDDAREPEDVSEPEDADPPASQVSDPFPSDGGSSSTLVKDFAYPIDLMHCFGLILTMIKDAHNIL